MPSLFGKWPPRLCAYSAESKDSPFCKPVSHRWRSSIWRNHTSFTSTDRREVYRRCSPSIFSWISRPHRYHTLLHTPTWTPPDISNRPPSTVYLSAIALMPNQKLVDELRPCNPGLYSNRIRMDGPNGSFHEPI